MHVRMQVARFLTRNFLQGDGGGRSSSALGADADANGKIDGNVLEQGNANTNADTDTNTDEKNVVNPDHVLLTSGGASVLNLLFFTLAEEKDVVLIPAPYYAAFEADMKVRVLHSM